MGPAHRYHDPLHALRAGHGDACLQPPHHRPPSRPHLPSRHGRESRQAPLQSHDPPRYPGPGGEGGRQHDHLRRAPSRPTADPRPCVRHDRTPVDAPHRPLLDQEVAEGPTPPPAASPGGGGGWGRSWLGLASSGPIGPPAVAQLRHATERSRASPGAVRASPRRPEEPGSVHGSEPLQGGASREDAGVCDLRGSRAGAAGGAAGVALRGPSVPGVRDPTRRPGSGGVAHARVVVRRVPHGVPVPGARSAPGPAHRAPRGPAASRVVLVGVPPRRGRVRVRGGGGPCLRDLPSPLPGVPARRGAPAVRAHDAPLVPRGAVARRGPRRGTAGAPTRSGPRGVRSGWSRLTGWAWPGRGPAR